MLAAKHGNLCVVGDDDQSIYAFRGATIENILNFERHYPHAKVIRLEENYRSSGNILTAANKVIAKNSGRKGKTLWTSSGPGEPVRLIQTLNESDEARFISETVMNGVAVGQNFRDFCALYRTNAQSSQIERQLRLSGIPYKVVGGMKFFERAEVKDMMAYLQVIHNPGDDLRLLRILNVPARGIGGKGMAVIRALAERDGRTCFHVLEDAGTYPELMRLAPVLKSFASMIRTWGQAAETLPLPLLYDDVIERSGYARALTDKSSDENRTRLENVMELKSSLAQYEEDTVEPSLGGFLDDTALFSDLDSLEGEENFVTLMTMHSAKGLEFHTVFLTGMEEGVFPGIRSQYDPEAIEEERRLCYVGVTRARTRLYLLCAGQRMLYGKTWNYPVSRFIEEMMPVNSEQITDSNSFSNRRKPLVPRPQLLTVNCSLLVEKGDAVTHKSFGKGVVLTVSPMGNDAMLEIAFEESGTKKLMRNHAAKFISKEG
jgi:DNA helicase-2/ATP-dependent DNA helicase PcrA